MAIQNSKIDKNGQNFAHRQPFLAEKWKFKKSLHSFSRGPAYLHLCQFLASQVFWMLQISPFYKFANENLHILKSHTNSHIFLKTSQFHNAIKLKQKNIFEFCKKFLKVEEFYIQKPLKPHFCPRPPPYRLKSQKSKNVSNNKLS